MVKKIWIEDICTDEVGEVQGAFDDDGNLLHIWCTNDGDWRHEYFNPIFTALGYHVHSGRFEDELFAKAKKLWG